MLAFRPVSRLVACLLLVVSFSSPAHATIINVPTVEYPTIQDGIDAAQSGDEVVLANGVYKANGNRDLVLNKVITIRSAGGNPETCVIDCEYQTRGLHVASSTTLQGTRIEGITFQKGVASRGAGLAIFGSCTFVNCHIIGNTANGTDGGGGIYIGEVAAPRFVNCVIKENVANNVGGGVRCEAYGWVLLQVPRFEQCTIEDNRSGYAGGGVFCSETFNSFGSELELVRCKIADNVVVSVPSITLAGAGVCVEWGTVKLISCTVSGNQIENPTSEQSGGAGLATFRFPGAPPSELHLTNCIIVDNGTSTAGGVSSGGGIWNFNGRVEFDSCTVANNRSVAGAAGLHDVTDPNASASTIENTILWNNTNANGAEQISVHAGGLSIRSCDVQGGISGIGGPVEPNVYVSNIEQDPQFVAVGVHNFGMEYTSPCLNNGDASLLPPDIFDLDNNPATTVLPLDLAGNPRQVNSSSCVDIGAYENQVAGTCPSDVTGGSGIPDGQINIDDLLALVNLWGQAGGAVDMAPGTCGNSVVDIDDLLVIINAWGTCAQAAGAPQTVSDCLNLCSAAPTTEEYQGCMGKCLTAIGQEP